MSTIKGAPDGEKIALTGNEGIPIDDISDNPGSPDKFVNIQTILDAAGGGLSQVEKTYELSGNLDNAAFDHLIGLIIIDNLVESVDITGGFTIESSLDNSVWGLLADVAALNAWIIANVIGDNETGTPFYIRLVADFGVNLGNGFINIIYTR